MHVGTYCAKPPAVLLDRLSCLGQEHCKLILIKLIVNRNYILNEN